jgi:hypothetical protein
MKVTVHQSRMNELARVSQRETQKALRSEHLRSYELRELAGQGRRMVSWKSSEDNLCLCRANVNYLAEAGDTG